MFTTGGCSHPKTLVGLLPSPSSVVTASGYLDLSDGFDIITKDSPLHPLREILRDDFFLLTGLDSTPMPGATTFVLALDPGLAQEQYQIQVDKTISITGGSYGAVVMALSSVWQSMTPDGRVPGFTLTDEPDYPYRSIMLDVARAWHHPETIKEIIDLCRWYKLNYLHLHLTDDSAFSFPSRAFPELATEGHSYTREKLIELNHYAFERGVILVPEMDVPGHSSQFIKKRPDIFGIGVPENNPYTVSMGREVTYDALEVLIGELADVFTHSPYIHIGGDEAFFEGMQDDPETVAYLSEHALPNLNELFRHFLIRLDKMVKKNGKQTIVWAGFGEHGDLQIPRDVIVMLWEPVYHHPDKLLAEGFPIINAAFRPLYVVNNRKWDPKYIFEQWTPNRWESWASPAINFGGIELPENQQVLGATLCAWEQAEINQLHRLRTRAAAMAEPLWSGARDYQTFQSTYTESDLKLSRLLRPFNVSAENLTYPEAGEGNFYEHLWFDHDLLLTATPEYPDVSLRYSLVDNPGKEDWLDMTVPLRLTETTHVRIQAFNNSGKPVGRMYHQRFFLSPVVANPVGLWKNLPLGSWEKLRFEEALTVELSTSQPGLKLHYTTDGNRVTVGSPKYSDPVTFTETTTLRAQAFDANGNPVGSGFGETYYRIWHEPSLTTGKTIRASNETEPNGLASLANNGRITLWEQWEDHKGVENWIEVDLETTHEISRLQVVTFWDNYRYYQYTIEGSSDGKTWNTLVDFSENMIIADHQGYKHTINPAAVRFLRLNMLFNSANPGLHVVEFSAWDR